MDRGGEVRVPVEERSGSNMAGRRALRLFYKKGIIVPHLISENMLFSPNLADILGNKSVFSV